MKKIISLVALAFVACSALMVTSCGSDDNNIEPSSNDSSSSIDYTIEGPNAVKGWFMTYRDTKSDYNGKIICQFKFANNNQSAPAISKVEFLYGKLSDIDNNVKARSRDGLKSAILTKDAEGMYNYTVDPIGFGTFNLGFYFLITLSDGSTGYLAYGTTTAYTLYGPVPDFTLDSKDSTAEAETFHIHGNVPSSVRSGCKYIAMYQGDLNEVFGSAPVDSVSGDFNATFEIKRTDKDLDYFICGGPMTSTGVYPAGIVTIYAFKVYAKK